MTERAGKDSEVGCSGVFGVFEEKDWQDSRVAGLRWTHSGTVMFPECDRLSDKGTVV